MNANMVRRIREALANGPMGNDDLESVCVHHAHEIHAYEFARDCLYSDGGIRWTSNGWTLVPHLT